MGRIGLIEKTGGWDWLAFHSGTCSLGITDVILRAGMFHDLHTHNISRIVKSSIGKVRYVVKSVIK